MHRILSVVVLPGLLLVALPAAAGHLNRRLKGDYAVALTSFCAQTQAGFDENGIALSPAIPLNRTVEDTQSFNGDGTFTRSGRTFQLTSLVTNTGGFSTSESEFNCTGTYQVNKDDSFTETSTCSGTVLSGGAAGQTFTQTAITLQGHVRGKTLLLSNTTASTPSVLTLSTFGNFFRLCSVGGSGVKIRKTKK